MITAYVLAGLLSMLLLTAALQRFADGRLARRVPRDVSTVGPPGARIRFRATGGGAGPTVVIEQGAGGVGALWWAVQDAVADFASVVSYDRRGLGFSDWVDPPRSVDERVDDLRGLLDECGSGPFVLVAHSYGGLIVRKFARENPDRVAGLVLVDTFEEGVHFDPAVLALYARFEKMLVGLTILHALGLPRLWRMLFPDREARSDAGKATIARLYARPGAFRTMRDDFRSLAALPPSEREPWPAATLDAMPLVVITHGQPFPGPFAVLERHWAEGQGRLAALSTRGELVVAASSNHMIQDDEPAIVIDAIRRVHAASGRCAETAASSVTDVAGRR